MTGTARRRGAVSLTGARAPATLQTHPSEQARSRRRDGPAPDQDLRVSRRPVWETGAMMGPRLTKIGLTRFKAFTDQELPISALTLLIGRNGSGKSNALDVLSLLALLADGRDLANLKRGGPEVAGLRGGLSGSAPFGAGAVKVDVEVALHASARASLSLTLDPTTCEVTAESLVLREEGRAARTLIDSRRKRAGSGLAEAQVYSGGAPRAFSMLSGRMATAQAMTRIPADTKARRLVVDTATTVLSVLRGVFVLDPVPAGMRDYTRLGTAPDRSGSSLSAQLHALQSDPEAWERLRSLVRGLVGANVVDLSFAEGRLPVGVSPVDVMVALVENGPRGSVRRSGVANERWHPALSIDPCLTVGPTRGRVVPGPARTAASNDGY